MCSAIRQRVRVGFAMGQGHRLDSTAGQYCRLAAQGCPGSLFRLFGYVGPEAMFNIWQDCWLGSLWNGAVGWAPQLPRLSGQSSWSSRTGGYTQQFSGAVNLLLCPVG